MIGEDQVNIFAPFLISESLSVGFKAGKGVCSFVIWLHHSLVPPTPPPLARAPLCPYILLLFHLSNNNHQIHYSQHPKLTIHSLYFMFLDNSPIFTCLRIDPHLIYEGIPYYLNWSWTLIYSLYNLVYVLASYIVASLNISKN